METVQSQLKLNLPMPMKIHVERRAKSFGMTVAAYVKHLIVKDIEEKEYPIYKASEKVEHAYEKAMKDKDKAIVVEGSLESYFANNNGN